MPGLEGDRSGGGDQLVAAAMVADSLAAAPRASPVRGRQSGNDATSEAVSGTCANCGSTLSGPFCAQCGQHVAEHHRSLWRLAHSVLDTIFSWDNKLLKTLKPLLFRPGFLTREFLEGRRVRYVNPLRLFLLVSTICVLLIQSNHLQLVRFDMSDDDKKPAAAETKPGENWFERTGEKIKTKVATDSNFANEVSAGMLHRLTWVLLATMPVFALLLRAVFWGKNSYYFGHLIFSLHYHTFLMMWVTVSTNLRNLGGDHPSAPFRLLFGSLLLIPAIYLFMGTRRVYENSRRRTLVKVLAIGAIHLLILLLGMAAVTMFTVLQTLPQPYE